MIRSTANIPDPPPEIPEPARPGPERPWWPQSPPRPLGPDIAHALPYSGDDLDDRLLAQRLVFCRGFLDDQTAGTLCARLMALAADGEAPIRLQLSAPDADPVAALAVVDTLDTLGAAVYATALGETGGPALAVLVSAERRHESQLAAVYQRLADVTGHTPEQIRTDARAGRYLTAAEALEYGLVQPPS